MQEFQCFPPPSPLLCEISFAQQADLILRTFTELYCCEDFVHEGIGGGHWGLSETEKPAKIFTKTKKTGRKIAQNRKNAQNNDQNCKVVIFNPSALDTTAKVLALGTIQCPCYTACSANLMRIIPKKIFAMFNQIKGIASSIVFVSYEGETFVTRDELKKVCTMHQFAPKNRITAFFVHKNRNPNVKKGKTVGWKTEESGFRNLEFY